MEKITSFTIDHTRLVPGVYVSRKDRPGGQTITTFDLRMTRPNYEPVMNTAEMHTIEHLAATFLRNHPEYGSRTIYFGPMGCRTGFYFITRDCVSKARAIELVQETCEFIKTFEGEIPGSTRIECGNYLDHSLPKANAYARQLAQTLEGWTEEKMVYEQ